MTSDLDRKTRRAEHGQGESGSCKKRSRRPNSLVFKILTSTPLGLKILQADFVKPAPGAGFRDGGEGGTPEYPTVPEMEPMGIVRLDRLFANISC